ncbi:MAG: ThuA domain-containing protein, partial [bacterium]|nr:ThuA domain-containing protein [bacterium]
MSSNILPVICLAAAILMAVPAVAAEDFSVLYVTKSVAFEHGPVVEKGGKPSVSEVVLAKLIKEMGGTLTTTKDGSVVNAESLKGYDLVIFYTQGDLTIPGGKDGGDGMSATGLAEMTEWIKGGGGFLGFHSATDTFRGKGPEPTPYVKLIGAEFRSHGKQFKGIIKVVDPSHPVMAHFAQDWLLLDEWYLFRNFNKESMRVLALMDPGEERAKQDSYNIPAYPVVWVSQVGEGRVY